MSMIDAGGCSIHVEVDGPATAPALILSNSLGANLHMWDEQAKSLSKKFPRHPLRPARSRKIERAERPLHY